MHHSRVAVGRAERFEHRRPRVVRALGSSDDLLRAAFDVLTLLEMAWHDCYGDVSPPEEVIDDVLVCSRGTLDGLVAAAHLAVVDYRDLALQASHIRTKA